MKKIFLSAALFMSSLVAFAAQPQHNLKFNSNGEFKIVQFTDMHLDHDARKNKIVEDMVKEVVSAEKPDLVIFTGDNTTKDEVAETYEKIASDLAALHTPWTAVLGNHDSEYAVSRHDIIEIIRRQPGCVMTTPATRIKGEGNHIIEIAHSGKADAPAAVLYCLDSHSNSTLPNVKGYGWLGRDQIGWYADESARYTSLNGGTPIPSLTFMHIALPEHRQAWESMDTKRFGSKNEKECPPSINTGMFAQMLECGDMIGVFVGHDHVNDYVATLYNVLLGFGRASGGTNTYGDMTPGARVIVLKEGKREFDSWIREKGNPDRLHFFSYPDSFRRLDKEGLLH